MRIEGWHAKEIFSQIAEEALKAGNAVMDEVVILAKSRCPVGHITREGKWKTATVSFTPTTGRGKGKPVSFVAQQSSKRYPGQLRDTIRRVNKPSRPGNIRVYVGNRAVNYAHFVEYGTVKMKRRSFMRPAFQTVKNNVIQRIEAGIAKTQEVVK